MKAGARIFVRLLFVMLSAIAFLLFLWYNKINKKLRGFI